MSTIYDRGNLLLSVQCTLCSVHFDVKSMETGMFVIAVQTLEFYNFWPGDSDRTLCSLRRVESFQPVKQRN